MWTEVARLPVSARGRAPFSAPPFERTACARAHPPRAGRVPRAGARDPRRRPHDAGRQRGVGALQPGALRPARGPRPGLVLARPISRRLDASTRHPDCFPDRFPARPPACDRSSRSSTSTTRRTGELPRLPWGPLTWTMHSAVRGVVSRLWSGGGHRHVTIRRFSLPHFLWNAEPDNSSATTPQTSQCISLYFLPFSLHTPTRPACAHRSWRTFSMPAGVGPGPRAGHRVAVWGGVLYQMGGWDQTQ